MSALNVMIGIGKNKDLADGLSELLQTIIERVEAECLLDDNTLALLHLAKNLSVIITNDLFELNQDKDLNQERENAKWQAEYIRLSIRIAEFMKSKPF